VGGCTRGGEKEGAVSGNVAENGGDNLEDGERGG